MADQNLTFVSARLTVLGPRDLPAFSIPCEEWDLLKDRLSRASGSPWFFQNIGTLLVGASLTQLIATLMKAIQPGEQDLSISWMVFAFCAACGGLSCLFAWLQKKDRRTQVTHVLDLMGVMENRLEPRGPTEVVEGD